VQTRKFAASERRVSEVGLGTWQLGGTEWGNVDDARAQAILEAAVASGITLFDTADIYGGGVSERRIGAFLKTLAQSPDSARRALSTEIFVATKLGRSADPGWDANFTYPVMRRHTEGSIERLGRARLDLTQTHCLPHAVMQEGQIFAHLRQLQREGLIERFGASVESVEEGLTCLDVEGLSSLQVIFNVFRQKPAEELFRLAEQRQVAIIVRLPLASGLLGGKLSASSQFATTDHRHYNRDGKAFNVGETFAGLGFERGLELTEQAKGHVPAGFTTAQFAMRFCLDFPAVTTVIPGASRAEQVIETAAASDLPPLSKDTHAALAGFYKQAVHASVRGAY
jgi:aryl-alcohol dehydrogenase-like predicted oxidoreductase